MARTRDCIIGLALGGLALPAAAQSVETMPPTTEASPTDAVQPGRALVFSALFGIQANPAYFGSDEITVGPSFRAGFARLRFGGIDYSDNRPEAGPYQRVRGLGYGLSFRYISPRDSDEYDEIDGLPDIDATLEIGGGIGYAWESFEVLADARYGLGGSDAWVGELRFNYVARPMDRLSLRVGPRLLFASDNYMDTYFGVSPAGSAASGLPAYDPDPGLVSVGIEAVAAYQVADRWWIEGGVRWSRFQGDAADSPIVETGEDEYTVFRLGIRRAFSIRF